MFSNGRSTSSSFQRKSPSACPQPHQAALAQRESSSSQEAPGAFEEKAICHVLHGVFEIKCFWSFLIGKHGPFSLLFFFVESKSEKSLVVLDVHCLPWHLLTGYFFCGMQLLNMLLG